MKWNIPYQLQHSGPKQWVSQLLFICHWALDEIKRYAQIPQENKNYFSSTNKIDLFLQKCSTGPITGSEPSSHPLAQNLSCCCCLALVLELASPPPLHCQEWTEWQWLAESVTKKFHLNSLLSQFSVTSLLFHLLLSLHPHLTEEVENESGQNELDCGGKDKDVKIYQQSADNKNDST